MQIARFEHDVPVPFDVQQHAGPVGVKVAVLLDYDIVEDIIGHAVISGLNDGGVGQRLMIADDVLPIKKLIVAADAAALQERGGQDTPQVGKDPVAGFVIEVFRCGLRIISPKLNGYVVFAETLDKRDQAQLMRLLTGIRPKMASSPSST